MSATAGRLSGAERRRVGLLFVYFYFAVATTVLTKTARNAFFLARFDAATLPYLFVVSAVVTAVATMAFGYLGRRFDPRRLAIVAGAGFAASLVPFIWELPSAAYAGLYVLVEIGTALVFYQFWAIVSSLLRPREAKRLLGRVGAGAGAANITVGLGLQPLLGAIGTAVLIPLATAAAAITGVLAWSLDPVERPATAPPRSEGDRTQADSSLRRYATAVAGTAALSAAVFTLVDYQFKVLAAARFGEQDMAQLFGFVYAATGAGALLTQLFGTGVILRRFGVVGGLAVLPMAQLLGSVWMAATSSLAAALWLRGTDRSFRFTVDQAARQILWMPLDAASRARYKPVAEESVRHFAQGAVGLALLVSGSAATPEVLGWLCGGLTVIWVAANATVVRGYLDRLRISVLTGRNPFWTARGTGAESAPGTGPGSTESLAGGLSEGSLSPDHATALLRVWDSGTPRSRAWVVDLASSAPALLGNDTLRDRALDPDEARVVREAALRALVDREPARTLAILEGLLDDAQVGTFAALMYAGRYESDDVREGYRERLAAIVVEALAEPGSRREAVEALVQLGDVGLATLAAALQDIEPGDSAFWRSTGQVLDARRSDTAPGRDFIAAFDAALEHATSLVELGSALPNDAAVTRWRRHLQRDAHGALLRLSALAAAHAPRRDVAASGRVLETASTADRADALEYLDGVLPRDVGRRLIPVLESLTAIARGEPPAIGDRNPSIIQVELSRAEQSDDPVRRAVAVEYRRYRGDDVEMSSTFERLLFLDGVELFRGLAGPVIARLAEIASERELVSGEALFEQGDPGESLFLVRTGRVELRRDAQRVASLSEGECFGEFAVLDGLPRTADAIAVEDTQLLEIGREEFLDLLAEDQDALRAVLAMLARRVREMTD